MEIERAFSKTIGFKQFYKVLDSDGSNTVDEKELIKILTPEQAKRMMDTIDWNGDRVLTFNELAWLMSQQQSAFGTTKFLSTHTEPTNQTLITIEMTDTNIGMKVVLEDDTDRMIITEIVKGSEAETKGIKIGDRILMCESQKDHPASNNQEYMLNLESKSRPLIITYMSVKM